MTNSVNQRCTVRRQSTKLLVFFSFFNVALSPQRPYGLLGRRSAGRQPRLSHSVPELWTTKPDTTDVYTNVWPFRRQERCLGGELCSCQSPDCMYVNVISPHCRIGHVTHVPSSLRVHVVPLAWRRGVVNTCPSTASQHLPYTPPAGHHHCRCPYLTLIYYSWGQVPVTLIWKCSNCTRGITYITEGLIRQRGYIPYIPLFLSQFPVSTRVIIYYMCVRVRVCVCACVRVCIHVVFTEFWQYVFVKNV